MAPMSDFFHFALAVLKIYDSILCMFTFFRFLALVLILQNTLPPTFG